MKHHIYSQRSGLFTFHKHPSSPIAFQGYAGNGKGLDNPDMEDVVRIGPLHCGFYDISEPYTHERLGPLVMKLEAWKPLFERSAFRIHGDNTKGDKSASQGCIILGRTARQAIIDSGVRVLAVIRD